MRSERKVKKRIISIMIALFIVLGMFGATTFASSGVTVILDGKTLPFDVPPQIMNGRTMVPLRAIFEAMGATINWDGNTQTVTATKSDTVVVLKIGSTSPTINGKIVTIDQPGVIVNGRTLAPLRFVAEAFGGKVEWNGGTQTATITSALAGSTAQPSPTPTQPSGGIDRNLVGEWSYNDITLHSNEHHNYFFYDNGTASFFITGGMTYHGEAKYSTSDGKIYLTEFYETDAIGRRELRKDKVVEYSIGTDERGVYLNIGNIPGWTDYAENRPMKFRK